MPSHPKVSQQSRAPTLTQPDRATRHRPRCNVRWGGSEGWAGCKRRLRLRTGIVLNWEISKIDAFLWILNPKSLFRVWVLVARCLCRHRALDFLPLASVVVFSMTPVVDGRWSQILGCWCNCELRHPLFHLRKSEVAERKLKSFFNKMLKKGFLWKSFMQYVEKKCFKNKIKYLTYFGKLQTHFFNEKG